jgi:serpin B
LLMLCATLLLPVAWAEAAQPAASDQAEAVKGNNAFAVELYGQLKNQPGNLFFSPESISTALAMTFAGAHGDTATEMANTLHFTLPPEKLHPAMAALLKDRNAAHDAYQLKVANALWGQQGYTFLDDFLKRTKDNYGAGFNQVDFKMDAEVARQTINQWVEQQTENKIKDLIAPGALKRETRLLLTNAIYFKGDWETQFKKEDTKDEDFHVAATQIVKAPMMHRTGEFNYFDSDTFQVLEIPYKNKELSMIVFLPKAVDGLSAFEQSLKGIHIWLGLLSNAPKVSVTMPRFKMETQVELGDTLEAMGIKQAFDGRLADFSGMAPKEEIIKDGNLYISAVIHKAFVDVNEEGTEAAAATGIVDMRPTFPSGEPIIPIFRADHPFLFLIRDNRSGSILFMGRVTNPSE